MRSVKTQGKGLSKTQRLVWLMSMPACAEVNDAMQTLTVLQQCIYLTTVKTKSDAILPFANYSYQTSEQHEDATEARKLCDYNDTLDLIDYLSQQDHFPRIKCCAALGQVSLLMRRLMSISARKWETRCYVLWLAKMRTTTHFIRKTKQLPLRARRLWG